MSKARRGSEPPPKSGYFIVLDEAPIKGSPKSKYDLLYGDVVDAVGTGQGSATTIKALLYKVPVGEPVYRTYLQRTDGKTGWKRLR